MSPKIKLNYKKMVLEGKISCVMNSHLGAMTHARQVLMNDVLSISRHKVWICVGKFLNAQGSSSCDLDSRSHSFVGTSTRTGLWN